MIGFLDPTGRLGRPLTSRRALSYLVTGAIGRLASSGGK
jgi:hypothetical protein